MRDNLQNHCVLGEGAFALLASIASSASSMSISSTHCIRSLLYLNKAVHYPPPSSSSSSFRKLFPFSLQGFFSTNINDSRTFAESYLINNFGFSPELASKHCSTYNLRFKTAEKPNSALTFFRNHGFSDSQLHNMIAKVPGLLQCDPRKRVLPKFEFFLSKGISNSHIVKVMSKHPYVLSSSLKNYIVPTYEFLNRFLQSDKKIIALLIIHPTLFANSRVTHNIIMLIENGMTDSCIARMLRIRCTIFNTQERDMLKVVEELKDLGFHPSKSTFAIALLAKLAISRTLWNEKVDTFKKWGWSDEDILKTFRSYPLYMLTSVDKINLVMIFWVNHMGWDALALTKGPYVFSLSLETRTRPRATVVQFLLKKGLTKMNASLTSPFRMPEKLFIASYIQRFEEHSSDLLKLYEEKRNHAYTARENTGNS